MKQLRHFSHEEHPLFLTKAVSEAGSCQGCQQQISSFEPAYRCDQCQYFLHKLCAERPREIAHPMHPQHPLRLLAKSPYAEGQVMCSGCTQTLTSGFTYHCSSCEFDLDMLCAFLDRTKKYKYTNHDHPLSFQPRVTAALCDACGTYSLDQSYQCSSCLFYVHKSCAFLPSRPYSKGHEHRLYLASCVPEEFRKYKFNCSVCNAKLHPSFSVYYCRGCRYFVHLKCMKPNENFRQFEANNPIQEIGSIHGSQGLGGNYSGQHPQQPVTGSADAVMDELERELSKIIGLEDLKQQLRTWAKGLIMDFRRQKLGINIGPRKPPHMAFLGNPGTGKTTVARILGRLLHNLGVLTTSKVVEVQRTDLVAEYIGQTGPKTKEKINEAEGGILFVDEAYRLVVSTTTGFSNDFGIEALEEIMSVMESGKLSVIFAGYKEPMQRLLASNEGFRRRVNTCFIFSNYSCEELAKIFHLEMSRKLSGFKLDRLCSIDVVASLIQRETLEEHRNKMNGGLVDQMLTKARENLDRRLEVDCVDENTLVTITLQDLEASLQLLNKNQENAFEENGH